MKGKQTNRSRCTLPYFRILILFLIKKFAYTSIGVSNKFSVRTFPESFIGAWKPITHPKLKTVESLSDSRCVELISYSSITWLLESILINII